MPESDSPKSLSPADALPPVEPPSAAFLVQLFLIPGIIVAIIVVVWLLFHWLAQMGNDPKKYVEQIRGHGETRWQAAVNLAGALCNPANQAIRRDPNMAGDLAQILRSEIAEGSTQERQINLRVYLCLALGQFETDVGLPALLEAVTTQRDPAEAAVRLAALKAIGDLAANVRSSGSLNSAQLAPTLLVASRHEDPPLRAAAALALGAVGGPEADKRLKEMLNDARAEVRYDVATALASAGDLQALDTLLEMLDKDQSAALADVPPPQREARQAMIHVGGLRAMARLADANPQADLTRAASAVEALVESKNPEVRNSALAVQNKLARQKQPAGAQNRRGLAHFAQSAEQNVPVPFSEAVLKLLLHRETGNLLVELEIKTWLHRSRN